MVPPRTDNSDPRLNVAALLLDIFERLGGIEQQLKAGEDTHDQFRVDLKELKERIVHIDWMAGTLKRLEPICDDYTQQKWKARGMWLSATGLAGVVGAFSNEIKLFFMRH